jgi:4-amino-4-deoxy-L-arabinose transferase-like glycosyltransferase
MSSEENTRPRFPFGLAGVLALVAGLLLRLWFVFHDARIAGDSLVYGDIAMSMIQRHAYGFAITQNGTAVATRSTLIRLPGYPIFLVVCFLLFGREHYTAVLLAQTAVDLGTCLLLGGLARRIFGHRAGVAAVWLAAICPFTAYYVAAPLTETLTLFCMALAFYALLRWREAGAGMNRWVWCIGFALAYALLLRPEQGMLAAAVVPAMVFLDKRNLRPALIVSVLTILPLAPWAARNWITFHVIQPLAPRYANDPGEYNPAGFERWYRTYGVDFASTENIYWNANGGDISIRDLPNRAFDSQAQYDETAALIDAYETNKDTITPALDARFDALARARIADDPVRYYVTMPVARVLNMIFRPRVDMMEVPLEWWKARASTRAFALAIGYGTLNLVYCILAVLGFARKDLWAAQRVIVWAMVATIVMRCALLLTLDNSETRYTLEFLPVWIVLGAARVASSSDPERQTRNALLK